MTNIDHILAKHFSGSELSPPELDTLSEWKAKNSQEYNALEQTLANTEGSKYKTFDTPTAWRKMESRIENTNPKVFNLKPILRYAAAASIAILLGIGGFKYFSNTQNFITISNSTSAVMPVNLPDGSNIFLAQHSTLDYHQDFKMNRSLKLDGEAFFDVSRDETHPFTISTTYGKVEVLGTSFNVNTNESKTIVSVKSGLVALKNKEQVVQLSIGESASSDGKSISEITKVKPNYLSWKTGEFTFDDIPLPEAINDLKTYFTDAIIAYNSSHVCGVTGKFNHQNIDEIIEAIALSCNLEFSKEGNKLILK